eukprot:gene20522-22541_t
MSSERFEDYEDELKNINESLERTLKVKLPKLSGEQRKAELRNADKQMEDASSLINSLLEEAQNAPVPYRSQMMTKGKLAPAAVGGFGREELLDEPLDPAIAQKNRMLDGLESLNRTSASVERSRRIADETDEYGVQIISDLEGQRESLLRSKDKVKATHEDLGRSRRILSSMRIRMATNKLIMVVIIFIELVILGAVVYVRFFKGKKK